MKIKYLKLLLIYSFLLCLPLSSCSKLFPPKEITVQIIPQEKGFIAHLNISRKGQVLIIQTEEINPSHPELKKILETPNTSFTLILPLINETLIKTISQPLWIEKMNEFHYIDLNSVPEYLKKYLLELKSKKIFSKPTRQNRYVPLKDAVLISVSPHESLEYKESTKICFKLIRGKTSFVFTPELTLKLIADMKKTFGKRGMRTDLLVSSSITDVPDILLNEFFGTPHVINISQSDYTETPIFESQGKVIKQIN